MRASQLIAIVEDVGERASCAAHVIEERPGGVDFCMAPSAEDAHWSGDLRIRWNADAIHVSLEHSGPIGHESWANNVEGREAMANWLVLELIG